MNNQIQQKSPEETDQKGDRGQDESQEAESELDYVLVE